MKTEVLDSEVRSALWFRTVLMRAVQTMPCFPHERSNSLPVTMPCVDKW